MNSQKVPGTFCAGKGTWYLFVISLTLVAGTPIWSAEKAKVADRGAAERSKRYAQLEEKLAQILKMQESLVEQSAGFKEELRIIKVRATSRGGIQQ